MYNRKIHQDLINDNNKWCLSINPNDHFLVLTNDIDSLLSCVYLSNLFNVEIGGYYDFKNIYTKKGFDTTNKKAIWVDADMTRGYCFGNHPTIIKNKEAVNLNHYIYSDRNYKNKYAGSTLNMLIAIYDPFCFSRFTPLQLKHLMAIDSAYLGYYNNYFKEKWLYWHMDILDIFLIDHRMPLQAQEIADIIDNNNLKRTFTMNEDRLYNNNINYQHLLDVLKWDINKCGIVGARWQKEASLSTISLNVNEFERKEWDNIFSTALIFRDRATFSYY